MPSSVPSWCRPSPSSLMMAVCLFLNTGGFSQSVYWSDHSSSVQSVSSVSLLDRSRQFSSVNLPVRSHQFSSVSQSGSSVSLQVRTRRFSSANLPAGSHQFSSVSSVSLLVGSHQFSSCSPASLLVGSWQFVSIQLGGYRGPSATRMGSATQPRTVHLHT